MTLARTALRLCVAQVLKGTAQSRPTIAEGRVYDSRISDFSPETFAEDAKPVVIILTDGDEGEALSRQNGGPPFRRMVDLVIELGMVQSVRDGDNFVVGYPDTDARHEASLDFLEFQIMRELAVGVSQMASVFRKLARIVKEESHRQVLDDSGSKIACRIVTLTCDTVDDQFPIMNSSLPAPTGFGVLPRALQLVAGAMPEGSSGKDICEALAASLSPVTVSPFSGMDIDLDANAASDGDPAVKVKLDLPEA